MAALQILREIGQPILAGTGALFLIWHSVKRLRRLLKRDKEFEDVTDKTIGTYKAIVDNHEFVTKALRKSYEEREQLIKAELGKTQAALEAHCGDAVFLGKLMYVNNRILEETLELSPDICFQAYEKSWLCHLAIAKIFAKQGGVDPDKLITVTKMDGSVKAEELEYPYNVLRYSTEQFHALTPLVCALNTSLEIHLRATELLLEKPDMDPETAVQKAAKKVAKSPSLFPPQTLAPIFDSDTPAK